MRGTGAADGHPGTLQETGAGNAPTPADPAALPRVRLPAHPARAGRRSPQSPRTWSTVMKSENTAMRKCWKTTVGARRGGGSTPFDRSSGVVGAIFPPPGSWVIRLTCSGGLDLSYRTATCEQKDLAVFC